MLTNTFPDMKGFACEETCLNLLRQPQDTPV